MRRREMEKPLSKFPILNSGMSLLVIDPWTDLRQAENNLRSSEIIINILSFQRIRYCLSLQVWLIILYDDFNQKFSLCSELFQHQCVWSLLVSLPTFTNIFHIYPTLTLSPGCQFYQSLLLS